MIEEILLLAEPVLSEGLETVLQAANPHLKITPIQSLARLEAKCRGRQEGTRLISFGSEIIGPTAILEVLGAGAYNFHPGPPTHPGRFPSCFFIYGGGERFGSTVHEMAAKVDSGPINAVDWFAVPNDVDRLTLDAMSFRSLFALFRKLAPHLAVSAEPLPCINEAWSGRATTQQDFEAMCRLPPDVSEQEFRLRYRAVGEGPNHALEISLFGHRFCLRNQQSNPEVLIGGEKRS